MRSSENYPSGNSVVSESFELDSERSYRFFHVAKAGGTSIMDIFELPDSPSIIEEKLGENERVCTVVRDPLDRFVSAFNYWLWLADSEKITKHWNDINDFAEKLYPGSKEMDFLKSPPDWVFQHVTKGAIWKLEAVRDKIVYIGKMEDWDKTIRDLSRFFKLKRSPKTRSNHNQVVNRVVLTPRARENIYAYVKKEYEFLESLGVFYDRPVNARAKADMIVSFSL